MTKYNIVHKIRSVIPQNTSSERESQSQFSSQLSQTNPLQKTKGVVTSSETMKLLERMSLGSNWKQNRNIKHRHLSSTGASTLEQLLGLPNELQSLILLNCHFGDVLSLRLVSRSFYDLVQSCESALVRAYCKKWPQGDIWLYLYPPPQPGEAKLSYFLNIEHLFRSNFRITSSLCKSILKNARVRISDEQFKDKYEPMHLNMEPQVAVLQHFFSTYRNILLSRALAKSKATQSYAIISAGSIWDDQADIISKYSPQLLLCCYHLYSFIIDGLEQGTLQPPQGHVLSRCSKTIAHAFTPASARQDIEILLLLGGPEKIHEVLDHRFYYQRRRALHEFVIGLDPNQNRNWKQNWSDLLGPIVSPTMDLDKVPNARIELPNINLVWVPVVLPRLLETKVIEEVDYTGMSAESTFKGWVSDLELGHAGGYGVPRVDLSFLDLDQFDSMFDSDSDDQDEDEAGVGAA